MPGRSAGVRDLPAADRIARGDRPPTARRVPPVCGLQRAWPAPNRCRPNTRKGKMDNICMIGLDSREVQWLRLLIALLRHPDPVVGKVAREALRYLGDLAERASQSQATG